MTPVTSRSFLEQVISTLSRRVYKRVKTILQKNRAFFERLARTYQKHDTGRSRYKKMIRMEHEEKAYSNGHHVCKMHMSITCIKYTLLLIDRSSI